MAAKLTGSVHPEFSGAGKAPGMEIWRIEKLVPTLVPAADHGKFFSGDSYIVLHTKKRENALAWDIYFWLGKETSQDEAGAAAIKTVELDDSLGGAPIQHREVQEHESDMFLSLFKQGIQYAEGGVASGFRKVADIKFEKKLLHLKGRRKVRVTPMDIATATMNAGDVYILDCNLKIFQFNGAESSRMERSKALEVATRIRDQERGAKATLIVINDEAPDQNADELADFWNEMGRTIEIQSADAGGDDAAYEAQAAAQCVLYQVSDATGEIVINEAGRMPLSKTFLDTNDTFVLDCHSELFVWIGKGATKQERAKAMTVAAEFLEKMNRPSWTPITRVAEGGETPLFKEKFADWTAQEKVDFSKLAKGTSRVAKVEDKGVDVSAMHTRAKAFEEEQFDDGSGQMEVYRVENFALASVDKSMHGQFFRGDSYVIFYKYQQNRKDAFVIYFWQGLESSRDEVGASALLTKQLSDERCASQAVQVRVVDGKEPNHFLALFKGKMIVRTGGVASGFSNVNDAASYDHADQISLFHVRGTSATNTRAVQVDNAAASLNSNDSFVLDTPGVQFVWNGSGASDLEKTYAGNTAKLLAGGRSQQVVAEGSEPDSFWEALGGKGEYASEAHLVDVPQEPRLFQCSNASGAFKVEEIFNFAQSDLEEDDVMILDVYVEVYVWIGKNSLPEEKRRAMETAVDYVSKATDGRSPDSPILLIESGAEPPMFTCHFLGWKSKGAPGAAAAAGTPQRVTAATVASTSPAGAGAGAGASPSGAGGNSKWTVSSPQGGVRSGMGLAKPKTGPTTAAGAVSVRDALKTYDRTYPLADLQKRPPPDGVDAANLEQYLDDGEFQTLFSMSKAEFNGLPVWKRTNLKKANKLF